LGSTWITLGVAKYPDAPATFPRASAADQPLITATSPAFDLVPADPVGAGEVACGPPVGGPVDVEDEVGRLSAPPHPAVAAANARTVANLQRPGSTTP